MLLLLFEQNTIGLFAWGNGSLVQSDLDAVTRLAPVIAFGVVALLLAARRLDILALGDDPATVARRRRAAHPASSSWCWPCCCPRPRSPWSARSASSACARRSIVRLLARGVPGVQRHTVLLPLSGMVGVLVVVGSDVLLRAVVGAQAGVDVPTGVVTTLFGAAVLVWLARRHRDAGNTPQSTVAAGCASRSAFVRRARRSAWC